MTFQEIKYNPDLDEGWYSLLELALWKGMTLDKLLKRHEVNFNYDAEGKSFYQIMSIREDQ